jgi:hypothetical protein
VCAALLLVVLAGSAYGKSITRLSGIEALHSLKKFYSVPNFKIGGEYEIGNEAVYEFGGKGGTTLESLGQEPLRVAYIAVGTPKRDENGKITNAVIISPYYSGDSTFDYFFWYEGQKGTAFSRGAVVGAGRLIDTNKYYVVFVDALGLWGASNRGFNGGHSKLCMGRTPSGLCGGDYAHWRHDRGGPCTTVAISAHECGDEK